MAIRISHWAGRALATAMLAAALTACASIPVERAAVSADDAAAAGYLASDEALATAARDERGGLVGISTYSEDHGAAVRAGDMAALVTIARTVDPETSGLGDFAAIISAIDAAVAGDLVMARSELDAASGEPLQEANVAFTAAMLSALEGDESAAIDRVREIGGALPGLTGDLALASLLEAFGRTDEALAVYESLTPTRIEAPDHAFDPKGILFAHTQVIVSRRALLLRRLGRVEEAKSVYATLAEAEPEQATRYADAIASLEDEDRFKDDEFLTPQTAFARSFSDLSLALFQRRIIQAAMMGARLNGLDENRSAMDQLALLLDPDNESLRQVVIDGLYEEAYYEGAAHVAESAPEPTSGLQLSAASAYLMQDENGLARDALDRASALATDDDERLDTLSGMLRLYTLLGEEDRAIAVAADARDASTNASERAVTHALTASALQHFGRADEAVFHAREARSLDDTHDRRMALADVLGEAGLVDEALKLIRTERLGRPNDPYMLNTLGYFLITRTDRIEEGYRALARAYALADRDPYIADSLGWARYLLGDLAGARRLIEQARAELEPAEHWEIEDHLGDIYWHQGNKAAARTAWAVALENYPPVEKAELIEAKLAAGLKTPAPEKRPIPDVSTEDATVDQQEI